jgi:hypothetical protein
LAGGWTSKGQARCPSRLAGSTQAAKEPHAMHLSTPRELNASTPRPCLHARAGQTRLASSHTRVTRQHQPQRVCTPANAPVTPPSRVAAWLARAVAGPASCPPPWSADFGPPASHRKRWGWLQATQRVAVGLVPDEDGEWARRAADRKKINALAPTRIDCRSVHVIMYWCAHP